MISMVTTKGQVTISVALRKRYGIHPNDRVDFIADGDRIVLVPGKTLRDFRGAVKGGAAEPEQELQAAKEAVGRRNVEEMG